MTFHIDQPDFHCQSCEVPFIPFKKDIACPNCGAIADEYFDFINPLVGSMKVHKAEYGAFMPNCWIKSSLTEHIQQLIFRIFDGLEKVRANDGRAYIVDTIRMLNYRDQEYLRQHTQDIALAVYDIYKNDPVLNRQPGLLSKVSRWLRSKLP